MQVKTCMQWLFLHYSCFLSPHLFVLCFFMLACFAFPGLLSPISCRQDIVLWNVCAKDDLIRMIRSTSLVGLCSLSHSQGIFMSKVKRSKGTNGQPTELLPAWVTKNSNLQNFLDLGFVYWWCMENDLGGKHPKINRKQWKHAQSKKKLNINLSLKTKPNSLFKLMYCS